MTIKNNLAKIYLARHCKTTWNIEKRLVGISDQPLSPEGLKEAKETAPQLRKLSIDRIVSSPLKRANQTASIYSEYLGVPLAIDPGLREIDHGDWNGIKLEELLNDLNSNFKDWYNDPVSVPIPNGTEPIPEALDRINKTMKNILYTYSGETILVVMHKHIRSIFNCFLRGIELNNFRENIDDSVLPIELPLEKLLNIYGIE